MSYQELMTAIERKLSERLAERSNELGRLHAELVGGESQETLVTRERIRVVNRQISKLANALADMAEAAGAN